MDLTGELKNIYQEGTETLFTLGVFDGVHIGHRFLIEKLSRHAKKRHLSSGIITFDPAPQSILQPSTNIFWLSDLKNKVMALKNLGIDVIVVLSFTQALSQFSAQEFISFLVKSLKMRGIMIGPDFTLGRNHEGNAQTLRLLGLQMAFSVEVVAPFTLNGETVSSTLIRRVLTQGDMKKVEMLMGRYFQLGGKVITSNKRGRVLGFPTANLDIRPQQALPGNGIYATIAQIDGKQFSSATNIGIRPTFGEGEKTVETHLLNYKGDLYGKDIRLEFVQKLRDEQRFPSSEELKAQIEKDVREVEAILTKDLK